MPTTLSKTACIIPAARFDTLRGPHLCWYYSVSLTKEQVQHIATLARLKLADSEFDDVVAKLSDIVDFVDQLQAVSTDEVVPMAHPLDQAQRLRPDAITAEDERERFQKNATSVVRGYYLVPRVIE